jgi:ribosome recycling factor
VFAGPLLLAAGPLSLSTFRRRSDMSDITRMTEELEEHMMLAIEATERDLNAFRTGKASPSLVEGIMVDYYGTQTRLRDIAGITTPEARLIVIQPWDHNALHAIEKAIQASNIGISPMSDGRVIRLPVPELSEERRRDLTKQVHKRAEEAKIVLRNLRRDANDRVKKAQKAAALTEDDMRQMLDDVQKLTDDYSTQVDELAKKKEAELMTI